MTTKAEVLGKAIEVALAEHTSLVTIDVVSVMRTTGSISRDTVAYANSIRKILIDAGYEDARVRLLKYGAEKLRRKDFVQVVFCVSSTEPKKVEERIPAGAEAKWRRLQQYTNSSLSAARVLH